MNTVGIKELKTNPAVLSRTVEAGDYLLISKRGKPFALATGLDNAIFDGGMRQWLLTKGFAEGGLSLGQLSKALDKSVSDTVRLLDMLGIPVLDYDLEDELDTLESLL
jgi:antitoxin (DNA-binding transcriptional repressor) of toxin-antitoxin stability system